MRFIAEYYLTKVQKIATEVIEAEDIQGASEEAQGKANDFKVLLYCDEA